MENKNSSQEVPDLNKTKAQETSKNKLPTEIKIVILIYIISLFLPSSTEPRDGTGFLVLMIGWLAPLQLIFSWYANPFWIAAIFSFKMTEYKKASIFSGISLVLASQYFLMYVFDIKTSFIDSERVIIPFIGYYVWVLALVSTFIISIFNLFKSKKLTQNPETTV
jgi:hypothetical protein